MLARKDRIAVPIQYNLKLAHQWLEQLYEYRGKPASAPGLENKVRAISTSYR